MFLEIVMPAYTDWVQEMEVHEQSKVYTHFF